MRRIVLFGPPLSGKATLLYAFARERGTTVVNRLGGDHATAPILAIVTVPEAELTTIPGCPWETSDWDPLLRESDAVIAVFDLQRARESEMQQAREQLEPFREGRRHLAVLTKADLAGLTFDVEEAVDKYRLQGWKVYVSSASTPATAALEAACQ